MTRGPRSCPSLPVVATACGMVLRGLSNCQRQCMLPALNSVGSFVRDLSALGDQPVASKAVFSSYPDPHSTRLRSWSVFASHPSGISSGIGVPPPRTVVGPTQSHLKSASSQHSVLQFVQYRVHNFRGRSSAQDQGVDSSGMQARRWSNGV